jgi:hypothetical protein
MPVGSSTWQWRFSELLLSTPGPVRPIGCFILQRFPAHLCSFDGARARPHVEEKKTVEATIALTGK